MKTPIRPDVSSGHTLERLDVPGRGGIWRLAYKLAGPATRRRAIYGLLAGEKVNSRGSIAKMRTLIDLGLWDDFDDGGGTHHDANMVRMALDWHVRGGISPQAMHLAIEAGVDPNASVSGNGDRVLAHMVYKERLDLARVAIAAGADMSDQEWPDRTAGHLLVGRGGKAEIDLLREMIGKGLDINHPGGRPRWRSRSPSGPPIVAAIRRGNIDLVDTLMGMGAALDWEGGGAMHTLADLDDPDEGEGGPGAVFMAALAGRGAMIDTVDKHGMTPLWSCVPAHPREALWLVEHGARLAIDIQHGEGDAAGRQGILERVMDTGADADAWEAVVREVFARDPGCWDRPCVNSENRGLTAGQLALSMDGRWAALASSMLMQERVADIAPGAGRRGPRF